MRTFDTPAPITAVLHLPAGRIQVIAADRADTTVEILPANPARGRDAKAAAQTTAEYAGGVLKIQAPAKNPYPGPSGAIAVTVKLPAGSRVEAKTAAAELRTAGRLGDVAFDGAYRQIKLEETARLRLTATDGDIEVGRLGGPAQISTARGDIRITEAAAGTVVLRTHSGDITIAAAAGVPAALDAGTTHGRITNTLTNHGTTALDIHATTSHGDITARSL
jgi:putative adhesin